MILKNPQKLASSCYNKCNCYIFINENITLKREAYNILNWTGGAQKHAKIEISWLSMMCRQSEQKRWGGGNVYCQQFGAEEGHKKVAENASPDKWF